MKAQFYIWIAFVCLGVCMACKKNTFDLEYKDVPRIMLWGSEAERATSDSTVFSFAGLPMETTAHNLTLVARIAGNSTSYDRTFSIEVDPQRTTAAPSEYELPTSFIIEAGFFSANIPIKVKKTPRMDETSVKLGLRLVSNEEFEASERSKFSFVWSNDVIMPSNWGNFVNYVGRYSKAKHRLILSSTPYKDLELITGGFEIYGDIIYIRDAAAKALAVYNAANPGNPMLNDEGHPIAICRQCD